MPRRRPIGDDQLIDVEAPPLMLPSPRPTHRHEHEVDPYQSPPGAVPVRLRSESTSPLKRKMTKADLEARNAARKERAMKAERYARYLEELTDQNGNQEQALAIIFGLQIEEVRLRRLELHAEVRSGLGSTTLADVLERNDLGQVARANLLRKHAYSAIPAASLKALDMVADLDGEHSGLGSFEDFLRLAKSSKG